MEVEVKTDKNLGLLVSINQLFGPPDALPRGAKDYPYFLGKEFQLGSDIYDYVFREGRSKAVFSAILQKKLEDPECKETLKMLDRLNFDVKINGGGYFDNLSVKIAGAFTEYAEAAEDLVEKTFGVPLPKKIVVVLTRKYGKGTSGNMLLSNNPVLIGYCTSDGSESAEDIVGVILHETLHAVLKFNSFINREGADGPIFEEALIDYFCPYGIISEKLGLIKKDSLDGYQSRNLRNRPFSIEMSKLLMPAIDEYYKSSNRATIWEFLKDRKFDTWINRKTTQQIVDER